MDVRILEQPLSPATPAPTAPQNHAMQDSGASRERRTMPTMFVMGTRLDNIREADALTIVRQFAAHPGGKPARQVFFTNVHTIYVGRKDREFMRTVNRADLVLPDGSGLKLYGRLFGTPVLENLNGTDFTPKVLEIAQVEGWSVYLIGSRPAVIEACCERLREAFPSLSIVGAQHGYFSPREEQHLLDDINAKQPNILLVAFGSPAQEKWIARNADRLSVGICFAVGGLFDFISGTHRRAPRWMRRAGLEWFFRFAQDPKTKWDRVCIEIPWFVFRIAATRIIPPKVRRLLRRGTTS